jgi:hypothetical protein
MDQPSRYADQWSRVSGHGTRGAAGVAWGIRLAHLSLSRPFDSPISLSLAHSTRPSLSLIRGPGSESADSESGWPGATSLSRQGRAGPGPVSSPAHGLWGPAPENVSPAQPSQRPPSRAGGRARFGGRTRKPAQQAGLVQRAQASRSELRAERSTRRIRRPGRRSLRPQRRRGQGAATGRAPTRTRLGPDSDPTRTRLGPGCRREVVHAACVCKGRLVDRVYGGLSRFGWSGRGRMGWIRPKGRGSSSCRDRGPRANEATVTQQSRLHQAEFLFLRPTLQKRVQKQV